MQKVTVTVELADGSLATHTFDALNGYDLTQEGEHDQWASAMSLTTVLDCLHGEGQWDSWEIVND